MTPELACALSRYNRWMNAKVYAAAAHAGEEERKRDRGAFFGSIHRTLNHLLVADRIWLGRFTNAALEDGDIGPGGIRSLDQELYSDFAALREQRSITDDAIESWSRGLTEAALAGPLRFVRRGTMQETPLWQAVAHAFNHQTHHRGQVTTLLSQCGHDVGVTDLFAMFREEAAPPAR